MTTIIINFETSAVTHNYYCYFNLLFINFINFILIIATYFCFLIANFDKLVINFRYLEY